MRVRVPYDGSGTRLHFYGVSQEVSAGRFAFRHHRWSAVIVATFPRAVRLVEPTLILSEALMR
jgi:hypothetical protein